MSDIYIYIHIITIRATRERYFLLINKHRYHGSHCSRPSTLFSICSCQVHICNCRCVSLSQAKFGKLSVRTYLSPQLQLDTPQDPASLTGFWMVCETRQDEMFEKQNQRVAKRYPRETLWIGVFKSKNDNLEKREISTEGSGFISASESVCVCLVVPSAYPHNCLTRLVIKVSPISHLQRDHGGAQLAKPVLLPPTDSCDKVSSLDSWHCAPQN